MLWDLEEQEHGISSFEVQLYRLGSGQFLRACDHQLLLKGSQQSALLSPCPRALPRLKPCALVPPAGLPPPAHSHPTREWFHDGQLIHAAGQLQPDWPARPASGGRQAAAAPGAAGGPAVPGNPGLSPCGCVTPRMLRPRLDACRRLRHPPFSGRCSPPGTFCLLPAAPKLFQADAPLDQMDPEIAGIIRNEKKRQVLPQRRAVLSAGLPLPATQPRPTAAQPPLRGCGVGCSGPW